MLSNIAIMERIVLDTKMQLPDRDFFPIIGNPR
jgi:hypothetical protein